MAKQDDEMKALLAASGGEREHMLGEQLAAAHAKVLEVEKAAAESEVAAVAHGKRCDELEAAGSRSTARAASAEAEIVTLREEVSRKDVEIAQLERSMAKQGEEMKALVSASGSERESH